MPPEDDKAPAPAPAPTLRILKRSEFVAQGNECTAFRDGAKKLAEAQEMKPVDPIVAKMAMDWAIVAEHSAGHVYFPEAEMESAK